MKTSRKALIPAILAVALVCTISSGVALAKGHGGRGGRSMGAHPAIVPRRSSRSRGAMAGRYRHGYYPWYPGSGYASSSAAPSVAARWRRPGNMPVRAGAGL